MPSAPFLFAMGQLPASAVTLDVGANIGLTSIIAAKYGATVHAFEPDPSVYPFLLDTIRENGAAVTAHNHALGEANGALSFFSDPYSASASHVVTDAALGRETGVTVPVSTVDEFVSSHQIGRVDFIKIDVEGHEAEVLKGGWNTIATLRPSVFVEFNAFSLIGLRNMNPRDLLAQIRDMFPYVYTFGKNGPVLIKSDADALSFIHDHLIKKRCIDDLLCSFQPVTADAAAFRRMRNSLRWRYVLQRLTP